MYTIDEEDALEAEMPGPQYPMEWDMPQEPWIIFDHNDEVDEWDDPSDESGYSSDEMNGWEEEWMA